MPNRLEHETSPYLLQHAHNPVDWYPWGEEALNKAKTEDKPVFLSIGYSACHWCHVMEHESFEDPETAALMNQYYVCIKVDREERPDLDQVYMQAVVAMTGQGGWPMSVFLTPEGVPFYGGTYYPNQPRQGMPSFRQVLVSLAEAWATRRDDVMRTTANITDFYQRDSLVVGKPIALLSAEIPQKAVVAVSAGYDRVNGGWGRAPKFPQPMLLEFLLRHYLRTSDPVALEMANYTLTKMAHGGIYDHLGGGFHRYATDAIWLVPHFEKMLYDNSQLARVYLHAWQITRHPLYRQVVVETLDYIIREMTDPGGGYYSTQDADSEGHEGRSYVWTLDEIREVLGDEAVVFQDAYGLTRTGNFEGMNILHIARADEQVAREHRLSTDQLHEILNASRQKLMKVRSQRKQPARDEKVLTAWNGLMLAAFAEAGQSLQRLDYQEIAERNADFLLSTMVTNEGRLKRSWKSGTPAKLNGYLEDYANCIEGLLTLYQTTFTQRWFTSARNLTDTMIAHFAAADGGFFDTSDDHEELVVRPREVQDNPMPSGNAMAATVLLKMSALTGEHRYSELALDALSSLQDVLAQHPTAFGQWLTAYGFAIQQPNEIAIVGDPGQADTQALLEVLWSAYRPNQVVALRRQGEDSSVPLLHQREQVNGKATVYICHNFTCQMPVTDPASLAELLRS